MNIKAFLASQRYSHLHLSLRTEGPFSPRDSEWNYSDVPHLNYIHSKVDACTLFASKNDINNIFVQKIGPFLLPASVHITHVEEGNHDYVMTILNIVVVVRTSHLKSDKGCLTTTDYHFYYRGILGWFICIFARQATRKNYQVLMAEDMPMRLQRGRLRRQGFAFSLDNLNLIGFADTFDIAANHVNGSHAFANVDKLIIDLPGRSGHVDIDQLKCSVRWNTDTIWILPMICPHEGAELCFQSPSTVQDHSSPTAHCPWHGRRLSPLAVLGRKTSSVNTFRYLQVPFVAKVITPQATHLQASQILLTTESPEV